MSEFLFDYQKVHPTTWVYISSLLTIGLFFKFSRVLSVRNLDLIGLILLAPGLLVVEYGIAREQPSVERVGYIWLFVTNGLFMIRLLLDPMMVRRPLLEPNLSVGGMTFLGISMLIFLMANVVNSKMTADDLAGHAAVAEALAVPVASGENRYRAGGLEALLAAGGADVLMPDPQRVGGVSGWLEAAELARRFGRPLTPHLFPEIGVHLVAATPAATWVEWMPWAEPLLAEPLSVRRGLAYVPEIPGAGMAFNDEAVRRYVVE